MFQIQQQYLALKQLYHEELKWIPSKGPAAWQKTHNICFNKNHTFIHKNITANDTQALKTELKP